MNTRSIGRRVNAGRCAILLTLIVGSLLAAAGGWAVVIDGYDDDWTSWDSRNDDPNEPTIGDFADISVNLFKYQQSDGTYYFYFRTFAPYQYIRRDYSAVLINSDKDTSTGGTIFGRPGLEYYLQWDLGPNVRRTTGQATLYVWDDVDKAWKAAGTTYAVARGDDSSGTQYSFVEWSLPRTMINTDSFLWAAYFDNARTDPDDYCPDDVTQHGFVPEPSCGLLLFFGVAALPWMKRRKMLSARG